MSTCYEIRADGRYWHTAADYDAALKFAQQNITYAFEIEVWEVTKRVVNVFREGVDSTHTPVVR